MRLRGTKLMTSTTSELQYVIMQALRSDKDVDAIVNGRIYDEIPDSVEFPYVSIGVMSSNSIDYDCIDIDEVTIQIDAWSRSLDSPEVRNLNDAIRRALTNNELTLENNGLISFKHKTTKEMREQNNLTLHGINMFEANIQRF